ncbi:MAG: hypothetical protein Q9178_001409 [Gyalolechia marmorata]
MSSLSSSLQKKVFVGTFIHTPTLSPPTLSVFENTIVGVDEQGIMKFIEKDVEGLDDKEQGLEVPVDEYRKDRNIKNNAWFTGVRGVVEKNGWKMEDVEELVSSGGNGDDQMRVLLWFGILVSWQSLGLDVWFYTHTHASQLPNTGIFGTSTLLDWLTTYTFPLESRFSSLSHARRVYKCAVASTLSHGTTSAAYNATIHPVSTNLLADICLEKGQRALVGNVCMDCKDTCPDYYREESAEASLNNTKAVVNHIRDKDPNGDFVQPIITPRFAPSCTKPLLSSLGELARTEHLPIQTHIAETRGEMALVKKMFPESKSYAGVYDSFHLLTPRTVLAHGIYFSEAEMELIASRGSGVSHCPLSNTSLGSGICPVRKLLDHGVKVGLGTDVSGGGSCSILTAAREASGVSRLLASFEQGNGGSEEETERIKLSVAECLYMATRGGAACLGLEKKVGAFEVGMEWDAQLVEVARVPEEVQEHNEERGSECWGTETWEERVAKWMYCGDDRNTRKVYVKGRLVHEG